MKTPETCLQLQLLLLIIFIEISTASKTKRQIVFEGDNTNRLFNSDCRTPDQRPGRCIRLTSCRALQTVSRTVLRRYVCGFEGDVPRVCCPLSRDEVSPTNPPARTTTRAAERTTRRPTVRTTTRFDESRNGGTRSTQRPTLDNFTKPPFLPRSCGISQYANTRVVGGSPAQKGTWPWMAIVFVRRSNGALVPDCGGALVTNSHVVTAAHCVVTGRRSTPLDPSRVIVRLGAYNLKVQNEPGAVDVEVESIRRHEQFEARTYKNDIAVLKLRRPVSFGVTIAPVCLPYDSLRGEELENKRVVVVGYGTTAFNGNSSDILMQATFEVLSQEVCKRAYEPEVQITRVYMCAGDTEGGKDACQGDSGGPLVAVGKNNSYYLVGVVSFGRQCGRAEYPGVYTRVTEFLDWLTQNLSN